MYACQVNYRCVGETKCTMNLLSDSCAVRRILWGRTLLLVPRHSVVVTDSRAGSSGSPDEMSRSSACGHQLTISGSLAFLYIVEKPSQYRYISSMKWHLKQSKSFTEQWFLGGCQKCPRNSGFRWTVRKTSLVSYQLSLRFVLLRPVIIWCMVFWHHAL